MNNKEQYNDNLAISLSRVKLAISISFVAWLSPLIIYWVLPFEIPVNFSYFAVLLALGSTGSIFYLSLNRQAGTSFTKVKNNLRSYKNQPLIVYIAMFSPVLTCLDMVLFRGVNIYGSLASNRDFFIDSSPSIFGYLSYVTNAAALLSLTLIQPKALGKQWFIIFPYVLVSIIFLISGNRQFILTGLFIMLFSYIMKSKVSQFRVVVTTGVIVVIFGTASTFFQFARQEFAEGAQLEHLEIIMGMECDGQICDSPISIPAGYLFHYYGTVYHGLSAYLEHQISAPMLSTTVPVFYKRFENVFDLESFESVRKGIFNEIESKTGVFPKTWKTMYGYILPEFSYFGIIIFVIISSVSANKAISGLLRTGSNYYFSIVVTFISFMTIGIMYVPTADPTIALVIIMSLLRGIWFYPRFSQ